METLVSVSSYKEGKKSVDRLNNSIKKKQNENKNAVIGIFQLVCISQWAPIMRFPV